MLLWLCHFGKNNQTEVSNPHEHTTESLVAQIVFACVNAPVADGKTPIEIAAAMVLEIADIFEDTTLGEELDLALVRAGFKQRPKYSTEYYTISESDLETIA